MCLTAKPAFEWTPSEVYVPAGIAVAVVILKLLPLGSGPDCGPFS